MLAQNFLTPEALHLTDEQHSTLIKVLGMLERGELKHHPVFIDPPQGEFFFDMATWEP